MTTFDYTNQCWVVDGIIQECGHTWDIDCGCYGRKHAGKRHVEVCASDSCDVCHNVNIGLTDAPIASVASGIKLTRKVWTKETVKVWLVECEHKSDCSKTRALITRALLFMYARQTQDEQSQLRTSHSNGVGFGAFDAEFLSDVARRCIKNKSDITPKQFPYIRKKLVKYSAQLVTFANTL